MGRVLPSAWGRDYGVIAVQTVDSRQPEALVNQAAAGSTDAWNCLVAAYDNLVWSISRHHGLSSSDAADVSQTVWLRLVEHIDRLHDPSRVGAWLATTARRESLRLSARNRRIFPTEDNWTLEERHADDMEPVDAELLRGESAADLETAMSQLPDRCQTLLKYLMADPPWSYAQISIALDIPVGSIGPTRLRCLKKLRHILDG